jgi:hypothetical protein
MSALICQYVVTVPSNGVERPGDVFLGKPRSSMLQERTMNNEDNLNCEWLVRVPFWSCVARIQESAPASGGAQATFRVR